MTYWLLPLTFPLVLQSLVLFLFGLIFAKPVGFRQGMLVMEWWDWFDHRWPFTTCIGYIFAGSNWAPHDKGTWFHEVSVHVTQFEDLSVLSSLIALGVYLGTGSWITALVIWGSGGPLWLLPNFLTALRFNKAGKELGWPLWKRMYMLSEHERSAYAQTESFRRNGGA